MMNPSSTGIWCNPPPPSTDEDDSQSPPLKESPERVIDKIDPFVKSAEYLKYERRRRTRSRSHHRRRRSHSRSRHRHRRRRYSSSRSRSGSHSRRRHKRSRHSRSRTRSRSHKSRRSRHHRSRSRRRSRSPHSKNEPELENKRPPENEEEVEEEEEEDDAANENMFKNDGSFLEMFKKMQEEKQQTSQVESGTAVESKIPPTPAFGKRRGGKILKTGMVQKNKNAGQEEGDAQDAWTLYMKEVKRYKEACCDDDSKTRLLVK